MNYDNSVNEPSYEWSGDVEFHGGGGSYNTNYTRSTGGTAGTISAVVDGATKTWSLDNQTIEAFVLACINNGIVEIDENFTTHSLSGTGGTLRSNIAGTQRTVTAENTGVASNCTFKDINMGSANKVNAKNGGTNNGNNKGIVFTDSFAPSLMGF